MAGVCGPREAHARGEDVAGDGHARGYSGVGWGIPGAVPQQLNVADLTVSSPAFDHHGRVPERHSGDGDDVAPPLEWSGVPQGTQAFAVVVHDPDAPLVDGFTHWVAYGIPGDATELPEGGGDVIHGQNSFGNAGYNGPAPPPGHGSHHYYFWIYALDTDLDLEPGLERAELLGRIEDHVIEQARLVGTYQR
jgi:Raf kinase inhibitor-like YbhB/YbcL family protein